MKIDRQTQNIPPHHMPCHAIIIKEVSYRAEALEAEVAIERAEPEIMVNYSLN